MRLIDNHGSASTEAVEVGPRRSDHATLPSRWIRLAVAGAGALAVTLVLALPVSHQGKLGPHPDGAASGAELSWVNVGGVAVPISRLDGPHDVRGGSATGYTQIARGAALASANVLIRSSASSGPRFFTPVFDRQMTGPDLDVMRRTVADQYEQLRAEAGAPEGQPVPDGIGRILGYVVADYQPDVAEIDVIMTISTAGLPQLVRFRIRLLWREGDWRVMAPSGGEWASVADEPSSVPAGMVAYLATRPG